MTNPQDHVPTHERPTDRTSLDESQAQYRAREESLGDLFSSFTTNVSTLFRQEVQLAKAEATASAKQALAGIGMLVGAAIGGLLLLIFLSASLMWALAETMHVGWAALIVAVIWAIITAVLAVLGKNRFDQMRGLEQTQETLQEIPPTINPNKETP